jgi:hypothetical protein
MDKEILVKNMYKYTFIFIFIFISSLQITLAQNKDRPSGNTPHLSLDTWSFFAKTDAGDLNNNWSKIDNMLYSVIIRPYLNHFEITNDSLRFSSYMSGHNCFDSTNTEDTIFIPRATPLDVAIVKIWDSVPKDNDDLSVTIKQGSLIVRRRQNGSDVLYYMWMWISNAMK